jgi:hypothetical protein
MRFVVSFTTLIVMLGPGILPAATQSQKGPVIPKWARFEQSFKSSVTYSNPLQQASLQVTFISPAGKTNHAYGFWDGGKTWKVRFAPDQVGRWSFQTSCSDVSNRGLHDRKGSFICTAPIAGSAFQRHGAIRRGRDGRHFEHADGTPFFWLADTTWDGPRRADRQDLSDYAAIRASQNFSVVQWSVGGESQGKGERGWSGHDRISIRPEFFQRLDGRLEILSRAGLLSAITLLSELNLQPASSTNSPAFGGQLPDDQVALLLRYAVARWNAEPVAWLLTFEGDSQGRQANRWKKIGQAVFGNAVHAPVIVHTGDTPWLLNEFREQPWADAFAYQTLTDLSDDAVKWAISGPLAAEWKNQPARPILAFTPPENGPIANSKKRFSSDDVRHAAWWSLLLSAPAGVSYSANGVLNWDTTVEPASKNKAPDLPLWRKSLFLPAAKEMRHLARFMSEPDTWSLRPRQEYVTTQPGNVSPRAFVACASTDDKKLTIVYTPQERTLDIALAASPSAPGISWLNPRTGESNPAVAVVGASFQFPTPDPGDWLLIMKAGK